MAVVINEFEVMSAAPPAPGRNGANAAAAADKKESESSVSAQELRAIDRKALRVWAH